MTKLNEESISILNKLIETCRDGQDGFLTAADSIKNTDLRTLFKTYSRQRAQFVAELEEEVRRLGGEPEKSGSFTGAIHRGWIDIKSTVTGEDEGAVIVECERGEDAAVRNYQEALAADLPSQLHTKVQRQYVQVRDSHDLIRALEKATT